MELKMIVLKNLFSRRGLVGAGVLLASAAARADDPFTAAVTDVSTKVGTYGAALVGVAAVGVGFAVGIKYVKKISRAA
jgi:uncharacterized protein (UPF0264 family)